MATIAEFTIPATSFPLGRVFEDYPNVTIELEKVVPTNSSIVPYFWIHDVGEGVIDELESHPGITSITEIDEVDGTVLVRVEWDPDDPGVLAGISETGIVLLSSSSDAEGWTLEVRAERREALVFAHQSGYYTSERGVALDEVADELERFGRALGSRLRRGIHGLVESTLFEDDA